MPEARELREPDRKELATGPAYRFGLDRRSWIATVGAGALISASGKIARSAQEADSDEPGIPPSTRLHLGESGSITVLTGKVEFGQGSRTEIRQAAAEELKVAPEAVRVWMSDSAVTPDDGSTAGSRTTPSTVPVVRRTCAAVREMLIQTASDRWGVSRAALQVRNGLVSHESRTMGYGDLARSRLLTATTDEGIPRRAPLTPTGDWTVLGRPLQRAGAREIVTGDHAFASDLTRPGMLHGAVLRAPAYGASLESVDLTVAGEHGARAIRDGDFVGCVARSSHAARLAVAAVARTARWQRASHPPSDAIADYLRGRAITDGQGRRGPRLSESGDVDGALERGRSVRVESYWIPFVQHAPLEPRSALAEWQGRLLTVWTGTQVPSRVHGELRESFGLSAAQVRVIVPDTGGGFGGKHTGEVAAEAARLAKAAGKPVSLRWTRAEEFMWAYFRPAAAFECRAALEGGNISVWDFTAYNPGTAAIASPYDIPNVRTRYFPCESPLREGSYRGIGATGNNFAREVFMDELAQAAGADPLDFRLSHLSDKRMRDVVGAAAWAFGWNSAGPLGPNRGSGIACGREKGSCIAICAQVRVEDGTVEVERLVSAFECGKILNPLNLRAQVDGAIIQGLGPALMEEVRFENGRLLTGSFSSYPVPRFRDVPPMETILLDRPDLAPAGGGETPIIAVAPALANAVADATGRRVRSLPLRRSKLSEG